MAHTDLSAALYYIQLLAARYEQIRACSQWRKEDFTIRTLFFSVGNGAMNAPRNLKRRNECFAMSATVHNAKYDSPD